MNQGAGIYVHLPFCRARCPYCAFYSTTARERIPAYIRALRRQFKAAAAQLARHRFASVFLGGGTPSLAPAPLLALLLEGIRRHCPLEPDAELSIEANPATTRRAWLAACRRMGFNRLSLGVQSLEARDLEVLGRLHGPGQAREAVLLARRAGFANISLDLIFGIPGQHPAAWRRVLEQALELEPEHLSLYALEVEEATPLARAVARGEMRLPAEEEVLEMQADAVRLCAAAGLERYEISSYARPGFQCRHNLNYWRNGPYFGAGAGAWSFLDGLRAEAVADLEDYMARMARGRPAWALAERPDPDTVLRETVITGLRLIRGVDCAAVARRTGRDPRAFYSGELPRLREQGLVELRGDFLRLTPRGLLLANQVMLALI